MNDKATKWKRGPHCSIRWVLEAGQFTLAIYQEDDEDWWCEIDMSGEEVHSYNLPAGSLEEAQQAAVAHLRKILTEALAAIDGEVMK